jgi:hypothetical protein
MRTAVQVRPGAGSAGINPDRCGYIKFLKSNPNWRQVMARICIAFWLAAAAGAILIGQTSKPALAEESTPIALIATVCMKTFINGERKEICGDFQLQPRGPSVRFPDQASCEAGKGEVLKDWREQAAQTRILVAGDRVENPRCVTRTQAVVPSQN